MSVDGAIGFCDKPGAHIFIGTRCVAMLGYITENMIPYSFCGGGGSATLSFFVYDAILGRPAKIHDGLQCIKQTCHLKIMSDISLKAKDSPWRFDLEKYCDIINYNPYPTLVRPPEICDAMHFQQPCKEADKTYCSIS